MDEATPLSPGVHEGGEIQQDEVEFFKTSDVGPGQELKIKITAVADPTYGAYLEFKLYDWDGDLMLTDDGAPYGTESYELSWFAGSDLPSHEIYLSIRCEGRSAGFAIEVSMLDHFDADSGADAGDTFEDSLELPASNRTYSGFIAAADNGFDDADFYEMTLDEGQGLEVELTPVEYRGRFLVYGLVLSIYDENRKVVAEEPSVQMDEMVRVEWTSPKRQKAYIKVHSVIAEMPADVICDYDLQVTVTQAPAASPTPAPPTTTPAPAPEGRCVIATAAYGSELADEVQELRGFRDNLVMQTMAGRRFMEAFNSFYYAWAPTVAGMIGDSEWARTVVRISIYPLISSLRASKVVGELFVPLSAELGVVVAGLVASSLLGLIYLLPPLLIAGTIRGWSFKRVRSRWLVMAWVPSLALVILGRILGSATLLWLSTPAVVLVTMLGAPLLALRVSLPYLTGETQRNCTGNTIGPN